MKLYTIFAFFVVFINFLSDSGGAQYKAVQNAFVDITNSLAKRNHLVSVVVVGNGIRETSTAAIFKTIRDIPHNVVYIKHGASEFLLNSSAIMLFSSMISFNQFVGLLKKSPTYSASNQIFIYIQNVTYAEIFSAKLEDENFEFKKFAYFVLEEETSIQLLTFGLYEQRMCRVSFLVDFNSFDKLRGKWKHENFFFDKFFNFRGCELIFLIGNLSPQFILSNSDNDNQTVIVEECEGYACAVLRDFSSVLNYTTKMILYQDSMEFGRRPYYDLNFRVRPMSEFYINQKIRFNRLVASRPVYCYDKLIALPPGQELNGYEKMVLPFDEPTWMMIGITFASAAVTIFTLEFVRPAIANFVMGKGIAAPLLNVLRAFFGQASVSPRRNFARYLLVLFVLFSLVVRTAYQGKMFEFLQKEIRKSTALTVGEMIDENFTFYVQHTFREYFNETELAKGANIKDNWTDDISDAAYQSLYYPGTKTGFIYSLNLHAFFMAREGLNITERPKVLKDRFLLESMAFVFPTSHFLFELFDRKLQQYLEADLINYNTRAWEEDINRRMFKPRKEPFAVLTLSELEAGFVVSLAPLILSVVAFGIEWLISSKDLMVFLFIFKKLFEAKNAEQRNHSISMGRKFAEWQELTRRRKLEEKEIETAKLLNFSCVKPQGLLDPQISREFADIEAWSTNLEACLLEMGFDKETSFELEAEMD